MKRLHICSFQLVDLSLLVRKAINTHNKPQKINGRRHRKKYNQKVVVHTRKSPVKDDNQKDRSKRHGKGGKPLQFLCPPSPSKP